MAAPTDSTTKQVTPEEAMRLAIEEAKKGTGYVSPNPLVGCTIVDRDYRLLAIGYHRALGQDHAEIDALKKITDKKRLEGAHVYVTLEPCAHEGRTPSCAKTLAQLPLASVVYGLQDPNPLVAGKGAEILRRAGIHAQEFEGLRPELEEVSEVFLHNMRHKQPFVGLKVATSLDGHMALHSGESKWITGEEARIYSHYLRASYDAVAIGRTTFLLDNPSLNIRHPDFHQKANKVILIDPSGGSLGELPQSNLLKAHDPENIFLVVRQGLKLKDEIGINLLEVATDQSGLLAADRILKSLWDAGIYSLFVEGGATTFGHFLRARRVQRLHIFMAPFIIGGQAGLPWTKFIGIESLNDRNDLIWTRHSSFGSDFYLTGRFRS